MPESLPSNVFVALATLGAAFIAGLVSFVTMTLTKEQKTSEFRQAWIDGLRADLAEYLASTRSMSRAIQELGASPTGTMRSSVENVRQSVAVSFYRIKLRLNPNEADHVALERLLARVVEELDKQVQSPLDVDASLVAIEAAAEFARPVLKAEWRVVKRGEPAYRITRNWIIPSIFLLIIAFVIFTMKMKSVS